MLPADKTTNDRVGTLARLTERVAKLEATAANFAQSPVIEKPKSEKQPSLLHDQIVRSDALAAENELGLLFNEVGWDEDADLKSSEPVITLPVKSKIFFSSQDDKTDPMQVKATIPLVTKQYINQSASLLGSEDHVQRYEELAARSKELFFTSAQITAETKRRYSEQDSFARARHNNRAPESNITIESAVFILFLAFVAAISLILTNIDSKNSDIETNKVIDEVAKTYESLKNRNN